MQFLFIFTQVKGLSIQYMSGEKSLCIDYPWETSKVLSEGAIFFLIKIYIASKSVM